MDNNKELKNDSQDKISAKDKSWVKQFKKSKEHGKMSAQELAQQKRREMEDKLIDEAASKGGWKGKAIAAGVKFVRNNKVLSNISQFMTFIVANYQTILIVLLITIVFSNAAIMVTSVIQTIGSTPHYYCDIDADKGVQRSGLFQQYCTNVSTLFALDNINGHYIVQDGSGPCTDCACLNLLLRYYTSKDINLYNYLWDNTGQFSADNNSLSLDTTFGKMSLRKYIATAGTTNCSNKPSLTRGSNWFAKKHPTKNVSNSNNFSKADWGYVRDESLSFEGMDYKEAIQTDEAKNISNNDNWVWDLSCETTWSAQWGEGNYVTIDGITATWEYPEKWSNKEELKALLAKYPSGIVAWRNYGSGNHAILITSWNEEEQCFNVVDSALATTGGFEGPATSSNFLIQSIWNESQIETCANVEKLVAIKEDAQ